MHEKVILILVDGMRPDSLAACGNPYVGTFLSESANALQASTIMPSVTLPCHMSLFHSIPAERHNVLTNTYTPMVRPVDGLVERISQSGKKAVFFHNWNVLRDLVRPDILDAEHYLSLAHPHSDRLVTDALISYAKQYQPDFAFLYLGATDETGHHHGWMGTEYLETVSAAWDCIASVTQAFGDDYAILVTADHGGHDRHHGTDIPEDMTIPVLLRSRQINELPEQVSILDLAPTIAALMGITPAPEWEGRVLL